MAITIVAEDVHDAASKLGIRAPSGAIVITWRMNQEFRFLDGSNHEPGCIVDAAGFPGEEVKRAFQSSAEGLRYIASLLKKHDDHVRAAKKKREQEERHRIRLAKALAAKKCRESQG